MTFTTSQKDLIRAKFDTWVKGTVFLFLSIEKSCVVYITSLLNPKIIYEYKLTLLLRYISMQIRIAVLIRLVNFL